MCIRDSPNGLPGTDEQWRGGTGTGVLFPDLVDSVDGGEILGARDIKRDRARSLRQVRGVAIGAYPLTRSPIETGNARMMHLGARMEVVEGAKAGHKRRQGSRNGGIPCVRVVVFSVHPVAVSYTHLDVYKRQV